MNYNDFSLPQNWQTIAKAYGESLKDKGFVFIRLDENQNKKNQIASTCHTSLSNLEIFYKQALRRTNQKQAQAINKLSLLSQELAKQLDSFYTIKKENVSQNLSNNFNFLINIFKNETSLIKQLMLLLDEEDNKELRQFLKTSLTSRLETLEKAFD